MPGQNGRIGPVRTGPFAMPDVAVALHAEPAAWAAFMRPVPPPGYQDLMGLVRRGELRVVGDMGVFMRHLLWFRRLFELVREQAA